MRLISLRALSFAATCGLLSCGWASSALALVVGGEAAPASEQNPADLSLRQSVNMAKAAQLRFPPIEAARLDQVRKNNSAPGAKRLQIGVDRILADDTNLVGDVQLVWGSLTDGSHVAHFSVASPQAKALRIQLIFQSLPLAAQLRFVDDGADRSVIAPVDGVEIKRAGQGDFWTPVTNGERQTVEIYLPAGVDSNNVALSVRAVAHLLASPYGSLEGLKIGESDPCQIDANCVANPSQSFISAKNAVARMAFQVGGGTSVCTGTLLNDTVTSSFIPYFFSANHCISSQQTANTLTTFFFEESTSCGSGVASPRTQVGGGATLLFNSADTDALLLRLNNPAPGGASFSGWDSSAVNAGTPITVLHHPAGDVKKVTLGQITGFGTYNGQGSFIRAGYTSASTEGGSSGAGILTFSNGQYFLRGGLFGGSAACTNTGNINNPGNTDAFSRFDVVFPSLQQFLAPSQGTTVALTVAKAGNGTGTVTSSPAGINCGGTCSANFNSGTQIVLTAAASAGSSFAGWAGCDSSSGANCTIALNSARTATATFNGSGGGGTVLQNGVSVTNLSATVGSTLNYTFTLPAGATNLVVRTSGGGGDPDLYLRLGSPPTLTTFDCRSFDIGPVDQCTIAAPAAGTWHVLIHAFESFSGTTLTASWQITGGGGGIDEPTISNYSLPLAPSFPSCPGGYFVATVEDGAGPGLTPGIFALDLLVSPPGNQRLEGGLNFGGLLDGSQTAFAGFNFINPANEQQRIDLVITGNPTSSRNGSLPVRIRVIRQPAANVNELVFETTTTLRLATQYTQSLTLTPAFYVVTVAPEGAASVPGGASDGEVFVSMATSFTNRPGGAFFGGVVVGGYHAAHPFGGSSGYAAFCLGVQTNMSAKVNSRPTYGATGARDLRIILLNHLRNEVTRTQ